MRVNQFWFPAATWVVETTSSLTPITPGTSRRIASASSIFKVPAPPQPVRMPLEVMLPEKIRITFCPRLAICASTCAFESEEHTSELQSHSDLVCRLLLEKKNSHAHS